jgi:acyl-CoA thioester hydrolase
MFEQSMIAGWGDVDFNAHMRNTAYLDKSADTRMLYFEHRGFAVTEFVRLGLGPVIRKDEVTYFREIRLLERFRLTLALAGMAPDGSHWLLRNEFFRADGQKAATVHSTGGWLDRSARKLIVPPPPLLDAMVALGKTADFVELGSSIR